MQNVESFFQNQKALFDEAVKYETELRDDLEHIEKDAVLKKALDTIRLITLIPDGGGFRYARLPELNGLMAVVHEKHDAMLARKRQELRKIVDECLDEIRAKAKDESRARGILQQEEEYFAHKREHIAGIRVLTILDGQMPNIWLRKDEAIARIENLCKAERAREEQEAAIPTSKKPKKVIQSVHRLSVFPKRTVETEADIDDYVEQIRRRMKTMLQDCDGIQLD